MFTNPIFIATSAVGLLLSGYTWYLEKQIISDPHFWTICEAYSGFDCRKPLCSSWTHPISHSGLVKPESLYDISLPSIAIVYYTLLLTYPILRARFGYHFTGLAGVGSMVTVYLAYIAKVQLHVICPICIAFYVVNFVILGSMVSKEVMFRERMRTL